MISSEESAEIDSSLSAHRIAGRKLLKGFGVLLLGVVVSGIGLRLEPDPSTLPSQGTGVEAQPASHQEGDNSPWDTILEGAGGVIFLAGGVLILSASEVRNRELLKLSQAGLPPEGPQAEESPTV